MFLYLEPREVAFAAFVMGALVALGVVMAVAILTVGDGA